LAYAISTSDAGAVRLYSFFRSSAAYRVRIALRLKGLGFETIPVNLRAGEQRSADYLAVNPQGLTPALEINGAVIGQSLAILDYLDSVVPAPRLIPLHPLERARVLAFAQTVACDVHPLSNLRVLNWLRERVSNEEIAAWNSRWIAEGLAALETMAARYAGDYCFGAALTVADVCLVPQIANARRFSVDLTPYPRLVDIDARLRLDPAFIEAAPENQPDFVAG
jgi:maleylacetoacetate isomerase